MLIPYLDIEITWRMLIIGGSSLLLIAIVNGCGIAIGSYLANRHLLKRIDHAEMEADTAREEAHKIKTEHLLERIERLEAKE